MDRTRQINFVKVVAWSVLISIAIALVASFAGCTTANKVTKFTEKDKNKKFTQQLAQDIFNKNDSLSADYCANNHPCKDSVYTQTVYVPGVPVIDTQWIPYNCDSAIKAGVKVIKIPIYHTTKVDTAKILEKVYQTDKAKLEQQQYECNAKLSSKQAEIDATKHQLSGISERLKASEAKVDSRTKWAWIGWVIIAMFVVLQILRSYFKF